MKIAVIGSKEYENKTKIKDFIFSLSNQSKHISNQIIIASGGRNHGADKYVKKYSIEFGLLYKEYNPAHTTYNLYSAMKPSYYGKSKMIYDETLRNKIMIDSIHKLVIFLNEHEIPSKEIQDIIKYAEKKSKKIIIVN